MWGLTNPSNYNYANNIVVILMRKGNILNPCVQCCHWSPIVCTLGLQQIRRIYWQYWLRRCFLVNWERLTDQKVLFGQLRSVFMIWALPGKTVKIQNCWTLWDTLWGWCFDWIPPKLMAHSIGQTCTKTVKI